MSLGIRDQVDWIGLYVRGFTGLGRSRALVSIVYVDKEYNDKMNQFTNINYTQISEQYPKYISMLSQCHFIIILEIIIFVPFTLS